MKIKENTIVLLALFLLTYVLFFYWKRDVFLNIFKNNDSQFEVIFLDVGQGDSILINTPNNKSVLIDAGRKNDTYFKLNKYINKKEIDLVVATHYDADHIGGLPKIFEKYKVSNVFLTSTNSDTKIFKDLIKKIDASKANVFNINKSYKFNLGAVEFYVLWPIFDVSETNASSIVLLVDYNDIQILLTGDAPKEVEEIVLDNFPLLFDDIEVLKAGHHGSKTSTSEKLLKKINAEYGIISAGLNNQYNHPSPETISSLEKYNIEILETKSGDIYCSFIKKEFICRN